MARPHRLVVTPWDGKNEDLLAICRWSVRQSTDAEHVVMRCGDEWQEAMFGMRDAADMVAWVDADDMVYGDAIERCFEALEGFGAGLAYTDEAIIDERGFQLRRNEGPRGPMELAAGPAAIHHLVVTKAGTIDEAPLFVHRQYPAVPLDWLMRARSGLRDGMKRVPMVGSGYRRHAGQITAGAEFSRQMSRVIPAVSRVLRSWI